MAFEKYALCFNRVHTTTAEKLEAKIKYSPELGDSVPFKVQMELMIIMIPPERAGFFFLF